MCIPLRKLQKLARTNVPAQSAFELARCNPYKYVFFIRIAREWNSLPFSVVEADNVNIFKSRLKSFLKM